MKKLTILLFLIICVFGLAYQFKPVKQHVEVLVKSVNTNTDLIVKEGKTILLRVDTPEGYKRVEYPIGSFKNYVRNYKLKAFDSKIINYDNSEYYWQKGHVGILEVPVPKNGLQQCADALIRIRSEYLWDANRKDEIGFNFTSGHYCSWKQYANGYRPKINGNKVNFTKTASVNHSKDNFYKYLNLIYMYSGTLSLYNELESITKAKHLKLGDMLILGGSPGHIVMLADEAINDAGEKLFLLIQGNTPAQSVQLVNNLEDTSHAPWYNLKINAVIPVSNFTFYNSKFVRFK